MKTPDPLPPHVVTPTDEVTYTRSVTVVWARGEGPLLPQSLRDARVTSVRLDYSYDFASLRWNAAFGPIQGHVYDDNGRLGSRPRALKARDHHPSGWPAWLIDLALTHQPHTHLKIQETP